MKPHIRRMGAHWYVYKDRTSKIPISCAGSFARLKVAGPWRPAEIRCEWFGDAKPS